MVHDHAPVSPPPYGVRRMVLVASTAAQAVIDLLQVPRAEGNQLHRRHDLPKTVAWICTIHVT
jgi:hypothetical protein